MRFGGEIHLSIHPTHTIGALKEGKLSTPYLHHCSQAVDPDGEAYTHLSGSNFRLDIAGVVQCVSCF